MATILTKHLGEATTCYLIQQRREFHGAWWLTDDQDARQYAIDQHIETRDTFAIMVEIVTDGDLTIEAAYGLMKTMADRDRHMRQPDRPEDLRG